MARNPKRLGAFGTILTTVLILALIAATAFVIYLCVDLVNQKPDYSISTEDAVTLPTDAATTPPETTEATEAAE